MRPYYSPQETQERPDDYERGESPRQRAVRRTHETVNADTKDERGQAA